MGDAADDAIERAELVMAGYYDWGWEEDEPPTPSLLRLDLHKSYQRLPIPRALDNVLKGPSVPQTDTP